MLSILTFVLLACAAVLGVVFSFENTLAVLAWGLGALILFPLVLILALLSVGLSAFESVLPVAGEWGDLLGTYVDGGYGFPGLYYLLGATVLWFITLFQFADEDAGTDETSTKGRSTKKSSTKDTNGADSGDSEAQDLSKHDRIRGQSADITEVDCLGNTSTEGGKSGNDRVQDLTRLSGVGDKRAEALSGAGYSTLNDVAMASQPELADVVGNALAARIKADVDGLEVDSEDGETGMAVDASGESETDSETGERETEATRTVGEGSNQSDNESMTTDEDKTTEEKEYEALTTVSGVRSDKVKELHEAGYESVDDLRNARETELATVVGDALSARIKADIGHSENEDDESASTKADDTKKFRMKDTDRVDQGDNETRNLTEFSGIVPGGTDLTEVDGLGHVATGGDESSDSDSESDDQEKLESESDGKADTSKTTGAEEFDKQLERAKEAVNSNIQDAMSVPFRDPESTRKQLIQAHKMTAELAERATESEHEDVLESAERTLCEIETRLEALSEAAESLKSARSHVPPDEGPSDSMSILTLEAAHESYTSAIEIADEAGFDTARLANERADIRSTLERLEDQAAREEMLEILQSLHGGLDRAPKANELPEECRYSQYDYRTEFGSWDEALEAAGIDRKKSMLEEIERVAEKIGRVPSTVDMQEYGVYSSYSAYFGSWGEALERADVEQNVDTDSNNDEREAMLEVLRDLNKQLGRAPKTTELPEECEYSPNDFYNEFGNWDKALEAVGIDKEQDMLEEIERVAKKIGRVPNTEDIEEHGAYYSYSSYFGSWSTALEKSGVEEDFEQNPEKQREEKIEILQSLNNRLGRLPKASELPEECKYSRYDYRTEFGSWDEALKAAGMNKEQALLDDIARVAENLGRIPKSTDIDEHGTYSYSYYSSYFDSWSAALERSGVEEKHGRNREEMLLERLQSLHDRLGRLPKVTDLHEVSGVSQQDYAQNFGSWDDALEAAGIDKEQALLDEIERVAEMLGRVPNGADMNEYGAHSKTFYSSYFGSWSEVLEAADFSSVDTNAALEQSSKHRPSSDQSSSSTQGANSNQIEPSALDTSWETIPANERVDEQFLIRVTDVDQQVGNRKTAQLDVQDQNGREFGMNIWSKHDVDREWREGEWYALENARGKVWESNDGTTRKQLSSTKDLKVIGLGSDFDPNAASAEATRKTVSEPEEPGATTDEGVPGSTSDSTNSDQDTVATIDDGESSEDDSREVNDDGVLDDIMSDFDEI